MNYYFFACGRDEIYSVKSIKAKPKQKFVNWDINKIGIKKWSKKTVVLLDRLHGI